MRELLISAMSLVKDADRQLSTVVIELLLLIRFSLD